MRPEGSERSAAAWFARMVSGAASPAERAQLQRRLAADPRFRREYQQVEQVWAGTLLLREDPAIAPEPAARARSWRRAGVALASAALLIATLWIAVGQPRHDAPAGEPLRYTTAKGEQRATALPDGSRITLNTGTRLDVDYREGTRQVVLLAGEATFDVSRERRHFEVRTDHGEVRVLGTVFNVERRDSATTVSVLEGRVQVSSGGRTVQLRAGEAVRYGPRGLGSVTASDEQRIRGWHAGRLRFHDKSLKEILDEYNRYADETWYVDPADESRRFTGSFRLANGQELIDVIESALDIRVHRRETP